MPDLEDLNKQLFTASHRGDLEALKALTPQTDSTTNSIALRMTAAQGHADCLRLLIPVSNPKSDNSYALQLAVFHGHHECVSLLIPVSDPQAHNFLALQSAAGAGHAHCVALLLPVSDPLALDANGNNASDKARKQGHPHVAAMIDAFIEAQALSSALPRVRPALPSKPSL